MNVTPPGHLGNPPQASCASGKTNSLESLSLSLPGRYSDDLINSNNNSFFTSEKFSYQKAVLDLMDLYVSLFGTGTKSEGSKNREVFFGPKDYMKNLPQDDPLFDLNNQHSKYLALKRRLFSDPQKRDVVFQTSGKHNDFWREFFKILVKRHPGYSSLANNSFRNNITGEVWDLNKHDPFFASVFSTQEDLVLLQKNGSSPIIDDASVCFPSRWNPQGAQGRSVKQTHEAVPKFIAAGLEMFIQRIMNQLEKPGVRFTRVVHPFPFLAQHTTTNIKTLPDGAIYTPDNVADTLFLRLEKQRFFRGDNVTDGNLAFEDLLLFSIQTYVLPLKAIEASPKFAMAMLNLHERFLREPVDPDNPDDRFLKYRGGSEAFVHPLKTYLERVASASEPKNPLEVISSIRVPSDIYEMPIPA